MYQRHQRRDGGGCTQSSSYNQFGRIWWSETARGVPKTEQGGLTTVVKFVQKRSVATRCQTGRRDIVVLAHYHVQRPRYPVTANVAAVTRSVRIDKSVTRGEPCSSCCRFGGLHAKGRQFRFGLRILLLIVITTARRPANKSFPGTDSRRRRQIETSPRPPPSTSSPCQCYQWMTVAAPRRPGRSAVVPASETRLRVKSRAASKTLGPRKRRRFGLETAVSVLLCCRTS